MKNSCKYIFILFLSSGNIFPLLANNLIAKGILENEQESSCNLTLGLSNWFPYQKISDKGIASGKQVELIQLIMQQAGCQLSYKSMTFPEGLIALKNGSVDFLVNATRSAEREKFGYFSIPYRNEFLLLYSTQKHLKECKSMSLTELIKSGFRLGLQNKLVYGEELSKIQEDPSLNGQLVYVENNIQHLQLMIKNDLDGIVDDPVVVSYRTVNKSTGKALSACPIVISSSPVSIIYSKKTVSIDQVKKIDQAIEKIKQTAIYQKNWEW